MLEQRLADALGNAPVGLTMDDHRIDATPDVVHGRVSRDHNLAGCRIDGQLARCAAIGKHRIVHLVVDADAELDRRVTTRGAHGVGQLEPVCPVVGGLARELAVVIGDALGLQSPKFRGHGLGSISELVRRLCHDGRGMAHRTAGMGPAADTHDVGIAEDDVDLFRFDAEEIGRDLGKAGLVALPAGLRADDEIDAPVRADSELGPLPRRADRRLDVLAEPATEQQTFRLRRCRAILEPSQSIRRNARSRLAS